ncbi:Uncharacterized protein Fot_31167 [Forsythia ovata]|uniref:Uncharacterized protein n=1 Tax=Forsythia ovata TaxID=205694 RepID=A0ABD1T487_9LAMI
MAPPPCLSSSPPSPPHPPTSQALPTSAAGLESNVTILTHLSLLQLDTRDLYSKSSPINGSNRNVHSPRPNDHIRWAPRNSGDTLFRLGIFLSLFLLNAVQSQSTVASIDHHLTDVATTD